MRRSINVFSDSSIIRHINALVRSSQVCQSTTCRSLSAFMKLSVMFFSLVLHISTCQADQVWKCGSVYTSQKGPGCIEVTAGVAKGITGDRVFSSPHTDKNRPASVSAAPAATGSAAAYENPRISGTLFSTNDDKPLSSSSLPEKPKTEDTPPPTAKCVIEAMLGDKEAAAKCGMPSLNFSELSKVLQ